MNSLGVVRRIDKVGRIVVPVEYCRMLGVKAGDQMEIGCDGFCITVRSVRPTETRNLRELLELALNDIDRTCRNCKRDESLGDDGLSRACGHACETLHEASRGVSCGEWEWRCSTPPSKG